MMYYCDEIILVEGKGDVCYLSSFIDSNYVITNGYDLPKEEIEFLKEASKYKKIIILTDSDNAGKNIRKKINDILTEGINIELDINKCNKNGKHGVAEANKEEIINKLQPYFTKEKTLQKPYKNENKYKSIQDKNTREYLSKTFNLGKCNAKTLIKRLHLLNIKEEDIERVLENYGNK